MKCLKCSGEKFTQKNIRFSPKIKGKDIDVLAPTYVCKKCNTPLMDDKQMNQLRRLSADKYRELNGLLTSKQIISYRESFKMSQSAFADYLKVGEASIKRWETYYIQDESQDAHIRLRCDKADAELNYLNLWEHKEPDEFNGNKKFNFELFKNVVLFLLQKTNEDILKLNKLHFYVDFYHFKKFGKSITGARFVPLKYGPCPDQYKILYESLENKGFIQKKGQYHYKVKAGFDLSSFDDQEKETLEYICSLHKKKGSQFLYDLSHQEKGYIETEETKTISYKYARNLQI